VAGTVILPGDADPRVARGFDRLAAVYDLAARLFPGDALRSCAEALLPRVPGGARVLVVGGGTGRVLPALLAGRPRAIVWLDASPAMCARARRRVPAGAPVEIRVGGLDRLGAAERFDAIVTPFVLDLWDGRELDAVVARLASALAPDGTWVHADFAHGRARALAAVLYGFFRVTCGVRARRVADWDEVFRRAGFEETARADRLAGILRASAFSPSGG